MVVVGDSSHDELPVLCIEGVLRVGSVVLQLVIAPPIVVSLLCIPLV